MSKIWVQNTEFHKLQKVLFSLLSECWTLDIYELMFTNEYKYHL